jgi:GH18 family chitinase
MIYFPVINFTTTSDVISAKSDAAGRPVVHNCIASITLNLDSHAEWLRNAPKLRKMGIKIIAFYNVWETAENVMRISGDAALRTKFAASVMEVMEQLQLDGLYFQWLVPGCPRVKSSIVYKSTNSVAHFYLLLLFTKFNSVYLNNLIMCTLAK